MTKGIEATFALLADTENEAAVDVLACALDSDQAAIRERALDAILTRRSPTGHREVIERLQTLDENSRAIIDRRRGRMTQALRDAVLSDQRNLCANACEAIVWFHEYDLVPSLITALEDDANPNSELAATTLVALVEALYAELAGPRDYRQRRDPQTVRRNVTTDLEPSVRRFSTHHKTAPIEAFLVLASRDNVVLKQILLDPLHGVFLTFVDLLTHSPRPGIMRLVLSYLDDPHAPSAALSILAHRTDSRFVEHLLRKIGDEPSAMIKQNLQRIDGFAWLRDNLRLLDGMEEAVQASAVPLVMAAAIKRDDALRILQHLLTVGKPRTRRAAAAALTRFPGADASQLVMRLVDDADPEVQSAAVAQLRPRGIPGALPILIELLGSPHESVSKAAREALAEFSFRRYLAAFDMLDEEVRRSTGELVKRIDSEAAPALRAELASAVRTRRLRAVRVVGAIGAARELEKPLLDLLDDTDHLIRAEAVRVLAECDSNTVRKALEDAQQDASPVVREAAATALLEWISRRRVAETDLFPAAKVERPVPDLQALAGRLAILAESDPLRDMGSAFRSRTDSPEIGTLFVALAILIAVVVLGWAVSRYLNRSQIRGRYYRPRALFQSLCRVHQLDRPARQLLWRLAQFHDLRHPARLFVEPERFDAERLPPPMLAHAGELDAIREQLFATSTRMGSPAA